MIVDFYMYEPHNDIPKFFNILQSNETTMKFSATNLKENSLLDQEILA